MRAFNRIAVELPLCVRDIREMTVLRKRDLGCRLILKYKMLIAYFFFQDNDLYIRKCLLRFIYVKLTHSRAYQKSI